MTNNNDFIVYPTSLTPNDNGINHLKDICNYLEIPILRFVDEKIMLKKNNNSNSDSNNKPKLSNSDANNKPKLPNSSSKKIEALKNNLKLIGSKYKSENKNSNTQDIKKPENKNIKGIPNFNSINKDSELPNFSSNLESLEKEHDSIKSRFNSFKSNFGLEIPEFKFPNSNQGEKKNIDKNPKSKFLNFNNQGENIDENLKIK